MASNGGNTLPRITKAEHIGPNDTGDNIEAKRVANYYWDGSNWQRIGAGLVPSSYDYIALSDYTGANPGTVTYKQGGSGGTTVATLTITYSGDNITSVTRT
jgi:hypothetical protein